MPLEDLLEVDGVLSAAQRQQLMYNPRTSGMSSGHLIHNATAQQLDLDFPRRFDYNPNNGPDITDSLTGVKIEIATSAQELYKLGKYRDVPAEVATYSWNPWYRDPPPQP